MIRGLDDPRRSEPGASRLGSTLGPAFNGKNDVTLEEADRTRRDGMAPVLVTKVGTARRGWSSSATTAQPLGNPNINHDWLAAQWG